MTSPTQRATAHCRAQGWPYAIVEHWVPMWGDGKPAGPALGQRRDLWGCIDLIVLDDEPGVLGVQVCAGSSHAARAKKMRETILGIVAGSATKTTHANAAKKAAALQRWLTKGNRLETWSFARQGERGARKLWTLRREQILTFQGVPVPYIENLEQP